MNMCLVQKHSPYLQTFRKASAPRIQPGTGTQNNLFLNVSLHLAQGVHTKCHREIGLWNPTHTQFITASGQENQEV